MDDNDSFTQIIMYGMAKLIEYSIKKEIEEYLEEKEDKEDGNEVLQR